MPLPPCLTTALNVSPTAVGLSFVSLTVIETVATADSRVPAWLVALYVNVIGPVPLGGRFWSAYVFDPWGTRLEFATDRSGTSRSVVESVLQTEEEARAELETLFSDPQEVEKWLSRMPLKKEKATA